MSKSIELNFTHPRETDKSFAAEVDGECTVAEALQHLQSKSTGPFLDAAPAGQPYQLVVHGKVHPPEATFGGIGVEPGAQVEVAQASNGATR